jgi:hypothetical protein
MTCYNPTESQFKKHYRAGQKIDTVSPGDDRSSWAPPKPRLEKENVGISAKKY